MGDGAAAPMSGLKTWFFETRPQFLLLTPVCVLVGLAVAVYRLDSIDTLHFILALVGALLAHISVNVLNDYFDFRSGLDLKTNRTPFSGGSGILPSGLLKPQQVYLFGMLSLLAVAGIGGYFLYEYGWKILPLGVVGVVVIYFYTTHFTKNPWVCAVTPGLGFGPLMVMGVYFTQTGEYALAPALASLVPGFLVSNLLLLNQFPDIEADLTASRRHIPIALGKRTAAKVYVGLLVAAYLSLVLTVAFEVLPLTALIGLLTLPLGMKAARGVLKHYDDTGKLIPFMGLNIQVTLLTPLLTGAGIFLGMLL
jgi:1,4-dihydroxy-2-naphthoate polyprenyltransferase